MKRFVSLCLAALLLLSMAPMRVSAVEMENQSLQEMEEAIKRNSRAEIRDADGNLLETLDVDVQVEQISTSRSADGIEYMITCTARAKENDPYVDTDSEGGYIAILTMICKDAIGTENMLLSVSGNFSNSDSHTDQREVTYAAYDIFNAKITSTTKTNVPWSFAYPLTDYTGFTFRAWASARVIDTGGYFDMFVTTADEQ